MKETEREKRSKMDFRLLERFSTVIFTVIGTFSACGIIFEGDLHQWPVAAICAVMAGANIYRLFKQQTGMKGGRLFGDMTPQEIEAFEKQSGSTVLFDESTGINFQKSKGDGDEALIILIDGVKHPLLLLDYQVDILRTYLNSNF
jgi:hypothetical protein